MDVIRNPLQFSDVKIILDDGSKKIKCHKVMLAAQSPFFMKLFTHSNVQEYHVGNVTSQSFSHFIDWIYKHQICLNFDVLLDLLRDADYLCCDEIVELTQKCLKLKISPENVLGTLMLCRQYSFTELEIWCWNYIEYNFGRVCLEEEFPWLPLEDLVGLLSSNKLNINTEIEAFNAIYSWVHHQLKEREGHFQTLFQLLQHSQLKMELIENRPKKFEVQECQKL